MTAPAPRAKRPVSPAAWLAALFSLFFLCPRDAEAGAWTQQKGHGLSITTVTISRASDGFDAGGAVIDTPDFRKEDYELYEEYGLTQHLTALLHLRYTDLHPEPPSEHAAGLGETELGMRLGLYSGKRDVVSVQASVFMPGGTVLTSGSLDGELRLNLGSDFRLWRWTGFLDTGFAYRGRMNHFRDELRADLTAGLNLTPSLQLLMQSFTVLTIGAGRTTAFQGQMSKAGLSLLYRVTPHWSLQLGGLETLSGTGVPRERAGLAALWYRF
jgi:hypothetical protein